MRSAMARPDAARGAGDHGDFSRHIEQGHTLLSQNNGVSARFFHFN